MLLQLLQGLKVAIVPLDQSLQLAVAEAVEKMLVVVLVDQEAVAGTLADREEQEILLHNHLLKEIMEEHHLELMVVQEEVPEQLVRVLLKQEQLVLL
jgi:hypothetical protein